MSDEVYQAIADASSGFVEAPAGCGKTEAIVRTVENFCRGPQLVLTHTHAGVDTLRRRFRERGVSTSKYHVDTIAAWSWGWVRKYPVNGQYIGSVDITVWNDVYAAMTNLLEKDFVKQGILNSYAGIIIDEYQDCTVTMHQLTIALKRLLPCRVLGDDLQGIFGFGQDALISWSDVKGEFVNDLGILDTPHRWIKAENESLGRWLLSVRASFRQDNEPDYRGSPVDRREISYANIGRQLIRLTHEKQGRICVIGPKARPLPAGLETALVNQGYRVLEPNDLAALRDVVMGMSHSSPAEKSKSVMDFVSRSYGGLAADEKAFIEKLAKGEPQSPRRSDRRALCEKHASGTTPQLLYDLLEYVEGINGVSRKLRESASALKCVLEGHRESGCELKALYAQEVSKRKHTSRSSVFRSIGSTLLVKGLEFDHAVILRSADWQRSWGGYKDLYVALTRGARTTTLVELVN